MVGWFSQFSMNCPTETVGGAPLGGLAAAACAGWDCAFPGWLVQTTAQNTRSTKAKPPILRPGKGRLRGRSSFQYRLMTIQCRSALQLIVANNSRATPTGAECRPAPAGTESKTTCRPPFNLLLTMRLTARHVSACSKLSGFGEIDYAANDRASRHQSTCTRIRYKDGGPITDTGALVAAAEKRNHIKCPCFAIHWVIGFDDAIVRKCKLHHVHTRLKGMTLTKCGVNPGAR